MIHSKVIFLGNMSWISLDRTEQFNFLICVFITQKYYLRALHLDSWVYFHFIPSNTVFSQDLHSAKWMKPRFVSISLFQFYNSIFIDTDPWYRLCIISQHVIDYFMACCIENIDRYLRIGHFMVNNKHLPKRWSTIKLKNEELNIFNEYG